ncbi:MAG: hypothetical protein CMH76_11525 [Nitrospinae bacterium]|nr:hypothetical protein [Nitrospinota bacterium]|tara:strand:- start:19 stop:456 length:438 start_codon:yes stop_codon:yes gene_type:complete
MAEEEKTEDNEEAPKEEAAGTAEASGDLAKEQAAPVDEELPKFTVNEIEKMNVPKLKEAALQYMGKITSVHGMDKAELIRSLKEINGIPLIEARRASKIDRKAIKDKIKSLHKERDLAIDEKDRVKLKRVRNRAKALRRKLVRNA